MAAKTRFTVGREQDCDIAIADNSVSRLHAEISLLEGEKLLVRDCNSRNGTEIIQGGQSRRIAQDIASASDTLRFGEVTVAASEIITAVRMLLAVPTPTVEEPHQSPTAPPPHPAAKPQPIPPAPAVAAPKPSPKPPTAEIKPATPAKQDPKDSPKPLPSAQKPEPAIKTELIRCECGAVRPREGRCAVCGAM